MLFVAADCGHGVVGHGLVRLGVVGNSGLCAGRLWERGSRRWGVVGGGCACGRMLWQEAVKRWRVVFLSFGSFFILFTYILL